jgi:hypothetical protein
MHVALKMSLVFLLKLLRRYFVHEQVAQSSGALHDRRMEAVKKSMEQMAVGFFVFASPSFLKAMAGGFDCSEIGTDGMRFLDIQPAIECDISVTNRTIGQGKHIEFLPDYITIRNYSILGLSVWGVFALRFMQVFLFKTEGKFRYMFLSAKMQDHWYWWELILFLRKCLIMLAGLFNTTRPERGWYMGSLVIVISLTMQSFARPFKDKLIDLCETVSLLSTLIIFQAGMVWSMTKELAENDASRDAHNPLTKFLEVLSLALIAVTTVLGVAAQYEALMRSRKDTGKFSRGTLLRKPLRDSHYCCRCGPRNSGLLTIARMMADTDGNASFDIDSLLDGGAREEAMYAKLEEQFQVTNPLTLKLPAWLQSVGLADHETCLTEYLTTELQSPPTVLTVATMNNKAVRKMTNSLELAGSDLDLLEEAYSVLRSLVEQALVNDKSIKRNPIHTDVKHWLSKCHPPLDQYEDKLRALLPGVEPPMTMLALANLDEETIDQFSRDMGLNNEVDESSRSGRSEVEGFRRRYKKLREYLDAHFINSMKYIEQKHIESVGSAQVKVEVLEAKHLTDGSKTIYPYVVVQLLDEQFETHKTKVKRNPKFHEDGSSWGVSFSFDSKKISHSSTLEVKVFDKAHKQKDGLPMGLVTVPISDFTQNKGEPPKHKWYALHKPRIHQPGDEAVAGAIQHDEHLTWDHDEDVPDDCPAIKLAGHATLPTDLHSLAMLLHNHMDDSQVDLEVHARLRSLMGWWVRMVNKYAHFPWSGSALGDYVMRQLDQCSLPQLRVLIKFEAARKNRRAILDSMKCRILVNAIMRHPAVRKLTENTISVKRDAVAIALHFEHTSELAEIVRVISEEKENAMLAHEAASPMFAFISGLVGCVKHWVFRAKRQNDKGGVSDTTDVDLALPKESIGKAIKQAKDAAIFVNPLRVDDDDNGDGDIGGDGSGLLNYDVEPGIAHMQSPSTLDAKVANEVQREVQQRKEPESSYDIRSALKEDIHDIDHETNLDQMALMTEYGKVALQDLLIAKMREDAFDQQEGGAGAQLKDRKDDTRDNQRKLTTAASSRSLLQESTALTNTEENIRTANTVAKAFARQIVTMDPDANRVEPVRHSCIWGDQKLLPLPLQTTEISRRLERFLAVTDVFVGMINEIEFHRHKNDGIDVKGSIEGAARREIARGAMGDMDEMMGDIVDNINTMDRYEAAEAFYEDDFNLHSHVGASDHLNDMMDMEEAADLFDQYDGGNIQSMGIGGSLIG